MSRNRKAQILRFYGSFVIVVSSFVTLLAGGHTMALFTIGVGTGVLSWVFAHWIKQRLDWAKIIAVLMLMGTFVVSTYLCYEALLAFSGGTSTSTPSRHKINGMLVLAYLAIALLGAVTAGLTAVESSRSRSDG